MNTQRFTPKLLSKFKNGLNSWIALWHFHRRNDMKAFSVCKKLAVTLSDPLFKIGVAPMKLKNLHMISKHTVVKYARFLVGGGVLFFAATAQAEYSAPGRVDGIEQGVSSFLGGVTFVRLQGVPCPGRQDGYFTVSSGTHQSQQLDLLLSSMASSTRRVVINHNPATCSAFSVGLCLTAAC